MKIRKGFVSNSSSSSFVCDLCNRTETGFDASAEDLGFVRCPNGHIICEDEALPYEDSDEDEDRDYSIPEYACPICMFQDISNKDFSKYFFKKYGISREEVFEEIKKVNRRRKKLYDNEYVQYVMQKHNLNIDEILVTLKEEHKLYENFLKSLYEN